MSLSTIRKGDTVVLKCGADAGKTGKVLLVQKNAAKAIVEGMRTVSKTVRKSDAHPQGGFDQKELPIAVSNLMPYCPKCKKGVRVSRNTEGDKDVRICKLCDYTFDS